MGEETEGVVESVSKLQSKVKALSGIDILTNVGEYKDTYTILKEIGQVWETMSDIDQAALLELLAGKNRANTLSAIISNMEDLEGAYQDALNAEGSAAKENAAYLDSIQGRLDLFNNSVQTMWMNTLNSEAVKFFVDIGTGVINLVDKLGLLETIFAGILTYFTLSSKHKLDLASMLGIHDLEKGFSVFGKQGLTGWIANLFTKKTKTQPNVVNAVLGDPSDIKVSAQDFADAIQDNINDYVTIDTTEVDTAIDGVQQRLVVARKQLEDAKSADWNYYKSLGSTAPAKDRDARVAAKTQEIQALEQQLTSLQARRDSIVSSATNDVAASMVTSVNNEVQAYQSLLPVLTQVKDMKLSIGDEQSAAVKIDAISQAAQKGQVDLTNYVSTLGDADIALKAYAASVKDGNYSLAGFQQFVQQHNAGLKASGIAAKAAAVGHQLLNTALSMGISMIVSFAIQKLIEGFDALIVTTEELTEKVQELEDTYKNTKETFKENLTELTTSSDTDLYATLEDEFKRLTRGVDEYGNNISLTSDQYERYKAICEKIVRINPQIAAGYDSATKAIGNNASVLENLIELQKIQARENAKQYLQSENLDTLAANAYNNLNTSRDTKRLVDNEGLNYWDQTTKFATQLKDSITSVASDGQNWDIVAYDLFALFGLTDQYDASISHDINSFVDEYYEVILSKLEEAVNNNEGLHYEFASGQILDVSADDAKLLHNQLQGFVMAYQDKVNNAEKDMQEARDGLINTLLQVPFSQDAYDNLGDKSKNILVEWIKNAEVFKIDPDATEAEVQKQLAENVALIEKITALLADESMQAIVSGVDNIDTSSATAREYSDAILHATSEIWEQIGKENNVYGFKSRMDLEQLFGIDPNETQNFSEGIGVISNYLTGILGDSVEDVRSKLLTNFNYKTMTQDEMQAFLGIDWNAIGAENVKSIQDIWDIIHNAMNISDITPVKTYSDLTTALDSYNEVLKQTSEIILDNTEVTQEYKDSLKELGISEQELAEYFDETNPLIVKNAKGLNDLVKASKNNIIHNTQLTKSQARLQYYELYKKMAKLVDANGKVLNGNEKLILSYYNEMKVIEQTIVKYSKLEAQLLGNVTAYEKFKQAQEVDSETDYISNVEEMALALGKAFNTAELGTESAQAAILGLVPPSVYEDLDTVDEKIAAIYDYFKNGKLSMYLDITWDDDGNIEGAEMKLGNLRKFIEDGLIDDGANVFDGADWQHFEFSEEFLAELDALPDGADKLQYFADKMGITKDVAFAFIKSLQDHDVEWLNGDYGSMFDALLPKSAQLEDNIYKNTAALAELNAQAASGQISAEEYTEKYDALVQTQNELGQQARDNINQYQNLTTQIDEQKRKVDEYTASIQKMRDQGKSEDEIKTSVEYKSLIEASGVYTELIKKRSLLSEPTEILIQFAIDNIDKEISSIENELKSKIKFGEDGTYTVKFGVDLSQEDIDKLQQYKKLWEEKHNIEVETDPEETKTALQEIESSAQSALDVINLIDGTTISIDTSSAISSVNRLKDALEKLAGVETASVTITPPSTTITNSSRRVRGYTMANGNAHESGSWGLSAAEHNSLVGELGQELVVNPHTGRYYTVGDNGAEMVDLPKDAIIFNHKQTEGLLKNGYITSRGQAYAEGNAHLTIYPDGSSNTQWEGTGYSGPDDPTWDAYEALSGAASDLSDSADEFREVFDWIEVRLEEINEQLDLRNAKLENAIGYKEQNKLIDEIIAGNKVLRDNLLTGAESYYAYAKNLLAKVPEEYQKAAQDGTIAIETFVGEVDEKTLEAIEEYREYAQKGADAVRQAEEVLTEISALAKQAIDNIAEDYENKMSLNESKIDQLDAYNALLETAEGYEAASIYEAMIRENENNLGILQDQRDEMQAELNAQVEAGNIQVNSPDWYEAVNAISEVDTQIIELTTDVNELQDSINELHWDQFDDLMERLEDVSDEADNLIDILSAKDLVDDMGNWTDEGITALGLYAQQMETAEVQAKKYQDEIDNLNKNWEALGYTEQEYYEKLQELKDGQYDAIKAYNDTKDAIVDLNKERVDAIKDGIEKEIEAYEELIKKKKEELDAEKDLHDFQKGVMEQQKDIAALERKLAALSADNSASARAERARLEAELAEAMYELNETYYDRSVSDQQEALDKELEAFQQEKDAEIEGWDTYLENTELVVSDSLSAIQANTDTVYQTLLTMGQEYGLSLTEALTAPWQEGALALQSYSEQFGVSMSATVTELENLAAEYQKVMAEIENAGTKAVETVNTNAEKYTQATKKEPEPQKETPKQEEPKKAPVIGVGSKINASGAQIYSYAGGTGYGQYYSNDPIYTVLAMDGDWLQVRHHSLTSGVTGWFKKSAVKAYAKGSLGVDKDQLAWIDELGEELQLVPDGNGRLAYIKKGTGILNADITKNLMELGQLDPSEVLKRSTPSVGAPHLVNNNIEINMSIAEVVHIDTVENKDIPDLTKAVEKQMDKYMQKVNNSLRKFTR